MSNIEIQADIESVAIVSAPVGATPLNLSLTTKRKKYILLIDSDFSGRIEIHCRDGGIAGVNKIERLQVNGKIYR